MQIMNSHTMVANDGTANRTVTNAARTKRRGMDLCVMHGVQFDSF